MKSKVLIVDDEVLTIEYLKSFPSWEKYGCDRIDSVWIASRALECFKKERHEIVFLDVRMPGVDGLTLSKEILQLEPDTMIVIMTAWQEYQYVKEAMRIGVKYFLAKHEITEETLDTVLGKICEEIRRKRKYNNVLWNSVLHGIWKGSQEMGLLSQGNHPYFLIMMTLRGLAVVMNDGKEMYVNEDQIRGLQIPRIYVRAFSRVESYVYGILCEYEPQVSMQNQKDEITYFLSEVKKVCLENTGLRPVFFVSGLKNGGVGFLEFESKAKRFAHSILWQRQEMIEENDLEQFTEIDSKIWPEQKVEEWSEKELQEMLEKGRETAGFIKLQNLAVFRAFLSVRADMVSMKEQEQKTGLICMEQFLRCGLQGMEEGQEKKSKLVRKALEYIRNHYAEDISSTAIAEVLHVSDGYLRTVFKKELACTIKEYILQYRIEKSKELLLKDEKKIYEIAAGCGFMSSQHFSRVFRQETGMTPGEYKKK